MNQLRGKLTCPSVKLVTWGAPSHSPEESGSNGVPLYPHDANGRHPSKLLQSFNCEAYHVKSLGARDINRVSLVSFSGTKRCESLILPVSPTQQVSPSSANVYQKYVIATTSVETYDSRISESGSMFSNVVAVLNYRQSLNVRYAEWLLMRAKGTHRCCTKATAW
jgi:hypothetical protein